MAIFFAAQPSWSFSVFLFLPAFCLIFFFCPQRGTRVSVAHSRIGSQRIKKKKVNSCPIPFQRENEREKKRERERENNNSVQEGEANTNANRGPMNEA